MGMKVYERHAAGASTQKSVSAMPAYGDQACAAAAGTDASKPIEEVPKALVVEDSRDEVEHLQDFLKEKVTREELENRCDKLANNVEEIQKECIKLQALLKESESARAFLQAEVKDLKERGDTPKKRPVRASTTE